MQIGPYTTTQIVEQLGDATVYAAQTRDGKPVLLTAITPSSAESARRLHARFYLVGKLQHPAILPLLANSQTDDSTFYTAVRRLPTAIPPKGALNVRDVLNISSRVSAALDYAHEQGVIHGHLRRSHIVRGLNGEIFLRGFELAGEQSGLQVAQDVEEFARLIYRALAGKEPGARDSRMLPRPITAVLRNAVIGEYGTAGAFHEALETAAKQKAPIRESIPSTKRSPRRIILIAVVLALLCGLAVVLVTNGISLPH
jgi:hypothetical protein